MIQRLQLFLGPARVRALFILLAVTGLVSLVLNSVVDKYDWVRPVQSLLFLVFIGGAILIFGGRMRPEERGRWIAIILPALVAMIMGLFFVPQYSAVLLGGSLGWIVAASLLTRTRMPMEYREAVKHLRKLEYAETIKVMDGVIRAEPNEPNHYRFRAEVFRVWGKLGHALRDYQKMTQLAPQDPVAYNGLAEVYLQREEFAKAEVAARKACELSPKDWVTYYNLGMIEDRLEHSEAVIEHLQQALKLKVKDSRHRFMTHFYLARAYSRLGQTAAAQEELVTMRRFSGGLEEWQTILAQKEADTLRAVIGDDIEAAQGLVRGDLQLTELART